MKILTIVGARPQFIKAGPVSRAMASQGVEEILVHTGQHYDPEMSSLFFKELDLPEPKFHLGVGSGSHGSQTASMLVGIERVVMEIQPDAILVYGDTNSTLAGALAASKLHVPVVHIEAGLRSWNRRMPEELNRITVDHLSELLLAPTHQACENLRNEGFQELTHGNPSGTHQQPYAWVGDVMLDALNHHLQSPNARRACPELPTGGYYLASLHRAQNTDDPELLKGWLKAFFQADRPVVFPLHPRTKAVIERFGLQDQLGGSLKILPPLGYLAMLGTQRDAAAILTDSGGVQKEAYILGVPCITLRQETEWTETLEGGWNRLCGEPSKLWESLGAPNGDRKPVYGDGTAAPKSVALMLQLFGH